MTTPEQKVINEVLGWAFTCEVLALPVEVRGARGWPDYIFIHNGHHVWIEFKRKGDRPRKLQVVRLRTLAKAGAMAYYFDNAADAINRLEIELF